MKSVRFAAVSALSSILLVSACSDSDSQSTSGEATSTAAADDAAATSDGSAATQQPGDEAAATAQDQGVAVMSVEDAEAIASDLLTKAEAVRKGDGEMIKEELDDAYRGPAREAAAAADTLESVNGNPDSRDLIADPIVPNVLAISRDDGEKPDILLVQTVPDVGAPVLHLMTGPSGTDSFRIAWSAEMLPGTDVGAFDRRSQGSPVKRDDTEMGDLVQAPQDVLQDLASYIDYPVEANAQMRTNDYAPQVRQAAVAQSEEVAPQADFTETNSVSEENIRTLLREDGSAITFAVLDRESVFDIESGMELTPPEPFVAFAGDDSLTESASLDTDVFIAVVIPTGSGAPEVIAAREQIVGASGS
ncbi:MAG: hypothetical protein WA994_00675 [Ornithinimicrobium sp.]